MNAPRGDHESLEQLLRETKKDVVESRNLMIKTDNLVKTLNGEVREITKRQELFEKRVVFNSAGAYFLYSVIIFAALYMVFQAQVAKEREAVVAAQQRITNLQGNVGELEAQLERRKKAEDQAYSLYRLIEEGKEEQVLDEFPSIRGTLVSRVESELLRQEVSRINVDIAERAFRQGIAAHDKRDYEAARDAFLKSLRHVERANYSPQLHLRLGLSLFHLQDHKQAADQLKRALEFKHDRATMNEAVYHYGVALDKLGELGKARTAYELYARRFAYDPRATQTQKRVFQLMREGIEPEGEVAGFTGAEAKRE